MNSLDQIQTLFPNLSKKQLDQFAQLGGLYQDWNSKVNLISRKDMDHFYERHVVYSLMIGSYFDLSDSRIMDVGTGGGFPGVPLAILFPDAEFKLVDSIGKKLKVVDAVAESLALKNITTAHSRMEDLKGRYDFITGRAVKSLPIVFNWTKHLIDWSKGKGNSGMLYLKGGEFKNELKSIPRKVDIHALSDLIKSEFFETKKLVYFYQARS
jgi:16S rRNA (guanine527-N7)-methyltransferase